MPDSSETLTEPALPLGELGQLFNSRLQAQEILRLLARLIAERLDVDCALFGPEPGEGSFAPAAWHARPAGRAPKLPAPRQAEALAEEARARARATENFTPGSAWAELGAESFFVVPVRRGTERLCLIAVWRYAGERALGPRERAFVAGVAPQAASALVNARILADERWQRQKAELMFQASKAVHTELHFDQAVREITSLLKQSIKVSWIGLMEYDPRAESLALLGSTAAPAVDLRLAGQSVPLADWPEAQKVLYDPEAIQCIPLPPGFDAAVAHAGVKVWGLPLMHKQMPQGLLLLVPPKDGRFSSEACEVAEGIAELVALAIVNQHLTDQEARARIQIIRSQAAAQEREVLLRQIVHDLRNATQAMSLVVEDMELTAGDNPALKASLTTIDSQITFISNFLREKLLWIQRGERMSNEHATILANVFADLESRFGPAARARHQRLVVASPEPVKVQVSSVQLEQIVGNLLDNAIKYTQPAGEVRLWADVSDGWVTLYVADNGPGIPQSEQARLGEIGYRGQSGETEGSGLGLANVRQLVTRAGGLFGVSSRENTGTTFHVSLPTTTWGKVIS